MKVSTEKAEHTDSSQLQNLVKNKWIILLASQSPKIPQINYASYMGISQWVGVRIA
jgi:hypothetical protein